jgi:peptide N-acetyl-beta-D-glucosaminyl asparaginase amidase A
MFTIAIWRCITATDPLFLFEGKKLKKVPKFLRWFSLVMILLILVGVVGLYLAWPVRGQGNSSHLGPRRVDVAESNIHAASAIGSANPIAFGIPVVIPASHPTTITILQKQAFGNDPPPAQSTVTLPTGQWKSVILTISGTQQGRQFDRLMLMWAANTQIFAGVTPEPTQDGIAWKLQKDVTAYLPLLTGQQTFTTWINNFVTAVYTGLPVVSVTLAFYPPTSQNEVLDAESASRWSQTSSIVPLSTTPKMATVHPNNALTATLTLPADISRAYLDLYAIAQIGDEFWWTQTPAFRELEVTIDGKPAGVVWPYPTVYTGGINPYLWRPITGINTMNMPAYRVNLTPFAGLLNGQHTISISVFNNQDYWLLALL